MGKVFIFIDKKLEDDIFMAKEVEKCLG